MSKWSTVWRRWAGICLLVLGLAGCASSGGGGRGVIGEINLFTAPMALNAGGRSAPSAIGVRVYACAPGGARGIAIRDGLLEIMMYDGAVADVSTPDIKPLKVWKFGADDLKDFSTSTSLGDGYQLALRWELARPTSRVVTVIARYRGAKGGVVFSAPSTVSVSSK